MTFQHGFLKALMFVALINQSAAAADLTNRAFSHSCSEKTTVYGYDNKKLVEAGKRIDGFCAGYLQASQAAFNRTSTCKIQDDNPDFLLSVYIKFVTDKNISPDESASYTLFRAYTRIAECQSE